MCSGAMLHARLARVVFGAADAKTGAAGSVLNLFALPALNHHTQVKGGVLPQDCAQVLKAFFAPRRANTNPLRQDALRTPDACFATVPTLPGRSHWVADLPVLAGLRLHWLEQAPPHAAQSALAVLCLHTAEGWAWDHRHVLPALVAQGLRVVAPDLIGFGQSDKPKKEAAHTPAWHAQVLQALLQHLGVQRALLLMPAKGPMARVGACLVAALQSAWAPGSVLALGCLAEPPGDEPASAAYDAPFPDKGYRAAPRAFARLTQSAKPFTGERPAPHINMNALPSLAQAHGQPADLGTPEGGEALAQRVVQALNAAGMWP